MKVFRSQFKQVLQIIFRYIIIRLVTKIKFNIENYIFIVDFLAYVFKDSADKIKLSGNFSHDTSFCQLMKITKELKKRKVPIVAIDKSLNKYDDIVLFPDKLEKANEMLRTVGLPKQWMKKPHR